MKKRALQVPSSHQPAERADAARHNNASDNSRESEVATQSSQNRPLASPARASSPSNEAEQARSGEEQAVPRHAESKVQVGVTSSEAPPSHPVVVFDNVEDGNTNPTDVTTSTADETHTGASGDEVKRHSASGTPEQKNKTGTREKADTVAQPIPVMKLKAARSMSAPSKLKPGNLPRPTHRCIHTPTTSR